MKKTNFLLLITLFGCMITFFSCIIPEDREQPECTSNCMYVTIGGKLYVKTDGKALSNVPISVAFIRNSLDFSKPSYIVASGTSNNSGTFNFSVTIDVSLFESYKLQVIPTVDSNYIAVDDGEKLFYSFDRNSLENINFEFYYKTNLTTLLNKISNDSIERIRVSHEYVKKSFMDCNYYSYLTNYGIYLPDSLHQETAADVYTKISWIIKVEGNEEINYTDSILCTQNGYNIYTINF
jgi:hypothetical protein